MADVYTQTGSGVGLGLVQTAYDRAIGLALRSQPLVRAVADKRPVKQAMPGDSVVLQRYVDLADATSALTETSDVDAVEVADTTKVTVTLVEQGNATLATRKLSELALGDVDMGIANLIAYNQASSIDKIAETALRAGTNELTIESGTVTYTGSATGNVTATDTLNSEAVRTAVTKLRGNSAVPKRGNLFHFLIHPDVAFDLRTESDAAGWRAPHNYADPAAIYAGEIGAFEGAYFVESPRLFTDTDGATSTKVYRSYVCGQEALAEAVAVEPHVVLGPVTDKLQRFRPIGWYGLLGFKVYREEALIRVETASGVAA